METWVVYVTVPDEATGARIAEAIVEERLAACVNMVPRIRSFYRWEGQVQDDGEALLFMKTTRDAFPTLRDRIADLHPYEVPCITAMPLIAGHDPYLEWVRAEVAGTPSGSN